MKCTVFDPRGVRDYLYTYPEIRRIPEFKSLPITQLKLVWWIANPTSPFADPDSKQFERKFEDRVENAIKEGGLEGKFTGKQVIDYKKGKFSDKLKAAIDRMSKIEPSVRIKAKSMIDTMFRNYEEIVEEGREGFKDKDGLLDAQRYATSMKIIKKELDDLIKVVEEGYGVKKRNRDGNDKEGQENANRYLTLKKDS